MDSNPTETTTGTPGAIPTGLTIENTNSTVFGPPPNGTPPDFPQGDTPPDFPSGVPPPDFPTDGSPSNVPTGVPPQFYSNSTIPANVEKGYVKNSDDSKIYPIVCCICGVLFIIGVYIYIFMTRNKKLPTGPRKGHSNNGSSNNSRNGSNENHSTYHSKGSMNNFSETFNSKNKTPDAVSPFSDTNYLIDNNRITSTGSFNFMNKDYGEPPEYHHKNEHYPNPLFNHSKPAHPNKAVTTTAPKIAPTVAPAITPVAPKVAPPIAPANTGTMNSAKSTPLIRTSIDTNNSDIPRNLNILTQEEAYLLNLKKNNLNGEDNFMGYPSLNQNRNLMQNGNHGMPMQMQMNNGNNGMMMHNQMQNGNNGMAMKISNGMPMQMQKPLNNNNGMQMQIDKQEKKMGDSINDDSFYNDSFIKRLGSQIKIETKKIEYEDETIEGPINKLKIKRFNN